MILFCEACGLELAPGESLLVTPHDGEPFLIHRYMARQGCFRAAGPACWSTIALYDPAAAIEWVATAEPDPSAFVDARHRQYLERVARRAAQGA